MKKAIFLLVLLVDVFANHFNPFLLQVESNIERVNHKSYVNISKKAFREVLVRLTGNKDVVIDEGVSAGEFVKSVKYNENSAQLNFDSEMVLSFIKNTKYNVWFGKRSKGLLYIIDEESGKIFDFDDDLKGVLKASARFRGIKIKVLDTHNVINLSQAAMAKYLLDNSFDYSMLCKISHFKGFDYIACQAPELGLNLDYEINNNNYRHFTESVVNDLSDQLASMYFSQSAHDNLHLRLKIDELRNYPEVQLVQKIVRSLPGVGFVEVEEINKGFVMLEVHYHGNIIDLSDLLDKDPRFLYKNKNLNERVFNYKWLGAV